MSSVRTLTQCRNLTPSVSSRWPRSIERRSKINYLRAIKLFVMEKDKENENGRKVLTKIPVPKNHLPQLPNHLLYDADCHKFSSATKLRRPPLRTLNSLLSRTGCGRTSPLLGELDSRHVTLRHIHDSPLDWDLRIFKEDPLTHNLDVKEENAGCDGRAVTPASSKLFELNRVRNIKKSLKRPHSRELLGLSPTEHDDSRKAEEVKRKLNYSEFVPKSTTPQWLNLKYSEELVRDYSLDIIQHLLSVERKTLGTARVSNVTRACVVNWLIKINPIRNPQPVQIACWYLDSLLAIEEVKLEDLQLLGAACYWVAQKHCMVACSARRLVKQSAGAFTAAELKTAEQKILSKLNFPPQPVTVHDFTTYLCWWCDPKDDELEVAATYLTMVALLADKWLASELPSALAAAIVTTALKLLHKRELLIKLKTAPVFAKPEVISNLEYTITRVRRAARLIALSRCEYRAPYVLYSQPPYFVALKLAKAISSSRHEMCQVRPVKAVMG